MWKEDGQEDVIHVFTQATLDIAGTVYFTKQSEMLLLFQRYKIV